VGVFVCVWVELAAGGTERKTGSTISTTPDRLMAAIRPLLSSQMVAEFSRIYKFVVMDELQTVHVYYLDLKNGQSAYRLVS